jgi:hypothetical protein
MRWFPIVACALVVASSLGCGEETKEGRFSDDDGAGGAATGQGGSGQVAGVGGAAGGGFGGFGGSPSTTQTVCANKSLTVGDLTLTDGDAEFNGHGPVVTTSVDVTRTAGSVVFEACVEMKETVSDWTTGTGCEKHTVNVANAGIVGSPAFFARYTDSDHEIDDVLSEADTLQNSGNLVINAQCLGDTDGNDICSSTTGGCSMCLFGLGCVQINKP